MEHIKAKGAKVIIESGEKENEEEVTKSGIIVVARNKDSGDDALLKGTVISVGTAERDDKGHLRRPDVSVKDIVWFNRYNAFKIINRGLKTFWVVDIKDIWCVENV